jgi:hypothetical protein
MSSVSLSEISTEGPVQQAILLCLSKYKIDSRKRFTGASEMLLQRFSLLIDSKVLKRADLWMKPKLENTAFMASLNETTVKSAIQLAFPNAVAQAQKLLIDRQSDSHSSNSESKEYSSFIEVVDKRFDALAVQLQSLITTMNSFISPLNNLSIAASAQKRDSLKEKRKDIVEAKEQLNSLSESSESEDEPQEKLPFKRRRLIEPTLSLSGLGDEIARAMSQSSIPTQPIEEEVRAFTPPKPAPARTLGVKNKRNLKQFL